MISRKDIVNLVNKTDEITLNNTSVILSESYYKGSQEFENFKSKILEIGLIESVLLKADLIKNVSINISITDGDLTYEFSVVNHDIKCDTDANRVTFIWYK